MQTIYVKEPRINIKGDVQKNHAVLQGGLRYTHMIHTADSYSNSQTLFNFQPPSVSTIVDRNMRIRCEMRVESNSPFNIGTTDAPRQMPIASITDNLQVQINGESVSVPVGDYIHAMLCYNNTAEQRRIGYSETTAMPDNYQNLSDWTIHGSGKCPLKDYGENSMEETRGGFSYRVVPALNLAFAVIYTFTEPVFISPFLHGLSQDEGFVNVNQFQFSYRWKDTLQNLWSHDSTSDPLMTQLRVTFESAPQMLVTYITHDYMDKMPVSVSYPYFKPQEYVKVYPNVPAGGTQHVQTDSIKLNQIPKKIYLFARRSRQSTTYNTADSFGIIKRVNMNWDNQSGLLAGAEPQELYAISKRNGCNLSWNQFNKYRGSVFCMEMGIDVGLPDDQAPGTLGSYTFSLNVEFTNPTSSAIDYEFYTLIILEGTFIVSENQGRATLGNLTPALVLSAKAGEEVHNNTFESLAEGGSFYSGLKHIVHRVASGVSKVAPVLSTAIPAFGAIGQVASGIADATKGGRLVGGRQRLGRRY